MTQHIETHFDRELRALKEEILKMGAIVEQMIDGSLKALVNRDLQLMGQVLQRDQEVDQLEIHIDDICLQMLALRQPAASDLRFIATGIKITKDLERMGDIAVNIVEEERALLQEPQLKPYHDLPLMGEKARSMVKRALDAFVAADANEAQAVCEMDDEVDELNHRIEEELFDIMRRDPSTVFRGVHLLFVSRQYERLGDHATNIAEQVVFMVKGQDIRHGQG